MVIPVWVPLLGRAVLRGLAGDAVVTAGKEAVKSWFTPPLSSGEVPPHLRTNWGDGGDKSDGNDPTIPPETPINNPPPVWNPPRKIYQQENPTPLRRLPKEGDGQTDTNIPNFKAITVKQAMRDREFGRLIPSPVSTKRQKIRLQVNRDIGEEVAALQQKAIERLGEWHGARMLPAIADGTDYLEKASLWDAFMLVSPKEIAGFKGDIEHIYGFESLKAIANYYRTTSRNAFIGIVDTIPKGYEIKESEIDTPDDLSLNRVPLMEMYGSIGLAGVLGQIHMGYKVPKDLTRLPTPEELEIAKQDLYNAAKYEDLRYRESIGQLAEDEEVPSEVKLNEEISEEIEQKWYDRIYSLAEHHAWFTRQVDAIAGQFPIDIEIEDNDLIQTGDQPIRVSLPNLADTLAELVKTGITSQAVTETTLQVVLRALIEGGADRQLNIQSHRLLEAVIDYLGFQTKKTTETVPFTYNPFYPGKQGDDPANDPANDPDFREKLSEALEPTDVEIETEEIDDESNLEKNLIVLLEAARIIKARDFRTFDPSNFKDYFKGLSDFLDGKATKPGEKSEWDKWIEEFENGFPGEIPENGIRPWGKNFSNRPKIRDSVRDTEK